MQSFSRSLQQPHQNILQNILYSTNLNIISEPRSQFEDINEVQSILSQSIEKKELKKFQLSCAAFINTIFKQKVHYLRQNSIISQGVQTMFKLLVNLKNKIPSNNYENLMQFIKNSFLFDFKFDVQKQFQKKFNNLKSQIIMQKNQIIEQQKRKTQIKFNKQILKLEAQKQALTQKICVISQKTFQLQETIKNRENILQSIEILQKIQSTKQVKTLQLKEKNWICKLQELKLKLQEKRIALNPIIKKEDNEISSKNAQIKFSNDQSIKLEQSIKHLTQKTLILQNSLKRVQEEKYQQYYELVKAHYQNSLLLKQNQNSFLLYDNLYKEKADLQNYIKQSSIRQNEQNFLLAKKNQELILQNNKIKLKMQYLQRLISVKFQANNHKLSQLKIEQINNVRRSLNAFYFLLFFFRWLLKTNKFL